MPDTHYDVFSQWPLISTSPNTPFPITLHPARILLLRYRRRFRPIPLRRGRGCQGHKIGNSTLSHCGNSDAAAAFGVDSSREEK